MILVYFLLIPDFIVDRLFNLYHSAPSNPKRSNSSDDLDFISAIEIQYPSGSSIIAYACQKTHSLVP
jgi:hypothetical protein